VPLLSDVLRRYRADMYPPTAAIDVDACRRAFDALVSVGLVSADMDWRKTLDLDLTGAFLCLQHAARRMIAQGHGGRLVAVTSIHEHLPLRDSAAYGAAKGGLGMLMKSLALELGPHGITANAVAPGEIATKMTDQEDEDPRSQERDLPVPRPGHAREIAGMIAFLASPEGAYTTGQSLVVDGGMSLMGPLANRG